MNVKLSTAEQEIRDRFLGEGDLENAVSDLGLIKRLDLHGVELEGTRAVLLTAALKANRTLLSLNLRGAHVEKGVVTTLLGQCGALQCLDVRGWCFSHEEMIPFAAAVKEHPALRTLRIGAEKMDESAWRVLGEAVSEHPRLKSMILAIRCCHVAAILRGGTPLVNLTLELSDPCGEGCRRRVTEAVKSNEALRSLTLPEGFHKEDFPGIRVSDQRVLST